MKLKVLPILFVFSFIALFVGIAQESRLEVLSSASEDVRVDNYQLSYTVGETISITQGNRYYFVTQGFHQVEWNAVAVWEYTPETVRIEVFPNPYSRSLNISFPDFSGIELFQYRILDLTFKEVAEGDLEQAENKLELSSLPPGSYLLNITKDQELIKTFRIIKI
ncbi:MAG: T9SS type A sorting domain-containing protein [Salibacteraceae bacterium]|nr:T9SS type A sorting domain-containing protein [Salibacteraceae bacterium]